MYASYKHQKFIQSNKKTCIIYGGRQSSKTYSSYQKVHQKLSSTPYTKGVLIASGKESLFRHRAEYYSHIFTVKSVCYLKRVITLTNGSYIEFVSLDKINENTSKRIIKGASIVHIEDAHEMKKQDYNTIRSLVGNKSQVVLDIVAAYSNRWIESKFFPPRCSYEPHEEEEKSYGFIKSSKKDTLILNTNYLDMDYYINDIHKDTLISYAKGSDHGYRTVYGRFPETYKL